MAANSEIPPGTTIDLSGTVIGLERATRHAVIVEQPGGPPRRIDGYTVGAPWVEGEPPHDGEMHPDGDELLFLVSGRMQVMLELDDGGRVVDLGPGQALVVPQGTWHQILTVEPGHLVHITPGPSGDSRLRPRS
jgi:mannose-6-phosphate isomerase-like protein (cupin superfamily)